MYIFKKNTIIKPAHIHLFTCLHHIVYGGWWRWNCQELRGAAHEQQQQKIGRGVNYICGWWWRCGLQHIMEWIYLWLCADKRSASSIVSEYCMHLFRLHIYIRNKTARSESICWKGVLWLWVTKFSLMCFTMLVCGNYDSLYVNSPNKLSAVCFYV